MKRNDAGFNVAPSCSRDRPPRGFSAGRVLLDIRELLVNRGNRNWRALSELDGV